MFNRVFAGRAKSGKLNPFLVIALPLLAGIVLALAWLGVANARLLIPFITGGIGTPAASPPWTDPPAHIELIAPVPNVGYHSPIDITGLSQTFEGHVGIEVLNSGGEVIAQRSAIGGSSQGFDFFNTYVRFTVTEVQTGTVVVFEESAQDGSRTTEISVTVTLLPGQRVVDLTLPPIGAELCNIIGISGYSNTFEATVNIDLRQRDGELITQTIAMGGNLGIYADFGLALTHPITQPQPLLVSAYESSAATGNPIDLARIPISLFPPESEQCP